MICRATVRYLLDYSQLLVLIWLMIFGIILKLGPGLIRVFSVLSDILERLLGATNKYIVNFINLMVLLVILNRIPKILRDTKVAFYTRM